MTLSWGPHIRGLSRKLGWLDWKDIGQQKEMDEPQGVMGNQLMDYCDICHHSQRGRGKTFGELEQGAKHVHDQI